MGSDMCLALFRALASIGPGLLLHQGGSFTNYST